MNERSRIVFGIAVVAVLGIGVAVWLLLVPAGAAGDEVSGMRETRLDAQAKTSSRPAAAKPSQLRDFLANSALATPGQLPSRPSSGQSTVTGRIVDTSSRSPVVNARVILLHPFGEFAVDGTTAKDGAFSLAGVPGVLGARLLVSAAGFGPRLLRDIHVPPNDRHDLGTIELARGVPITGRVVSLQGAPIADALVDLVDTAGSVETDLDEDFDLVALFRDLKREHEALEQVTSTTDGAFTFPGAAPGNYLAIARKPGWQVRVSRPVSVTPGAAPPHVEIRLAPAKGVRGIVRNEAGQPVAGALVSALEVDLGALRHPRTQRTTTNGEGRFHYTSFGDGQIALIVDAAGYSGTTHGNVTAGKDEIELTLRKAARIEGRVFDRASSKGLAGAVVVAVRLDDELSLEETVSGADGTFLIEAGPSGERVTVFAKLAGFTMTDVVAAGVDAMGEVSLLEKGDAVVPGSTLKRDLPMIAGGVVTGRVVDEATGKGIAGADVRASCGGVDFMAFSDPVTTQSGVEGAFRFAALGAGTITLRAYAEGYVVPTTTIEFDGEQESEVSIGQTAASPVTVELPPGGAANDAIVKLRKGIDVRVLVTDPEGRPVAGARVAWIAVQDQGFMPFGAKRRAREVASDASGLALLKGVAPTIEVTIAARHPDFSADGFEKRTLTVAPGQPIVLRLARGASLSGVVLESDGAPAANRTITVTADDAAAAAVFGDWSFSSGTHVATDTKGRFTFENLVGGSGTIHVHSLGKEPFELSSDDEFIAEPTGGRIDLVAGQKSEIVVRMAKTLSISGIVRDADGRGISASVHATPVKPELDGVESESWTTGNPDGSFVLSGLRPGVYTISAYLGNDGETEVLQKQAIAGATGVELRFEKK